MAAIEVLGAVVLMAAFSFRCFECGWRERLLTVTIAFLWLRSDAQSESIAPACTAPQEGRTESWGEGLRAPTQRSACSRLCAASWRPIQAAACGPVQARAGVAAAAGPPLGGLLVELGGWRLVFLVNLAVGPMAMVAAVRVRLRAATSRGRRPTPSGRFS